MAIPSGARYQRPRMKAQVELIQSIARDIQHTFTVHAIADAFIDQKLKVPERSTIHDALRASNEYMINRRDRDGWHIVEYLNKKFDKERD